MTPTDKVRTSELPNPREAVRGGVLPRVAESFTETTTISYSYDPLYRVTGATYTGGLTNSYGYAYDAVGNRTVQSQTITSTLVTTYGYDIANRLTSVNEQPYTWDDNGNLLNDGAQSYTYDQANRLKTAVQGAITTTFAYNGAGDRLQQTVNGSPTRYVLDPAGGLTQVLSDGTNTYLYGNGRIAQQATNVQYFGVDGLGSVWCFSIQLAVSMQGQRRGSIPDNEYVLPAALTTETRRMRRAACGKSGSQRRPESGRETGSETLLCE